MEKIIDLLTEKNEYLEKFYLINERELINFADGRFDTVEGFYRTRDKILDLIRCIDGLIDEENKAFAAGEASSIEPEHRAEIERLLKSKDAIVKAILEQDLQVLAYIEKEKSKIIRELREAQQVRRAVGAYAQSERLSQIEE